MTEICSTITEEKVSAENLEENTPVQISLTENEPVVEDIPVDTARPICSFDVSCGTVASEELGAKRLLLADIMAEAKRVYNLRQNIFNGILSPEDYIRTLIHHEISATLAALIAVRFEYLAASTADEKAEVLRRYKARDDGKFDPYLDAVLSQEICPEDSDENRRAQEWRLMLQTAVDFHTRQLAVKHPAGLIKAATTYLNRYQKKWRLGAKIRGYRAVLQTIYNIGGVDFMQYANSDLQIDNPKLRLIIRIADTPLNGLNKYLFCKNLFQTLESLKIAGLSLREELTAHLYISEALKTRLLATDPKLFSADPSLVRKFYDEIYAELLGTPTGRKLILSSAEQIQTLVANHVSIMTPELIRRLYTFKDTDLTAFLPQTFVQDVFSAQIYMPLPHPKLPLAYTYETAEQEAEKPLYNPADARFVGKNGKQKNVQFLHIDIPDLAEPVLRVSNPETCAKIDTIVRRFYAEPIFH